MSRGLIGRTIRRLRQERGLAQQALAARLGISASYLNLIEHDQRALTPALVVRLAETLEVDIAALSGTAERALEAGLRDAFSDPMVGAANVPFEQVADVAASHPQLARAVIALHRARHGAQDEAAGPAPASRPPLAAEEARDAFFAHGNHFPRLEGAADAVAQLLGVPRCPGAGLDRAITERLRRRHGVAVRIGPSEEGSDASAHRFDPASRVLDLSERLSREGRLFRLAAQLAALEAEDAIEAQLDDMHPSSSQAAALIRRGLVNYAAAALLMPYEPFLEAARALRHDADGLAARFEVGFEHACHRLTTLRRPGLTGLPFFLLRVDAAGNVRKRLAGPGAAFARSGGSCPRWVAHAAFATPGATRVQVGNLPDGSAYLFFARAVTRGIPRWGEPAQPQVMAVGCDIAHAGDIVYADGLDLRHVSEAIGLSCRMCERDDCSTRAAPSRRSLRGPQALGEADGPYSFAME